ncbi:hypothetical protein TIFTF001_010402 [Ficus carica]|uniref:Uncharacterized protein n=1 Tax=Ficus carica TaxID=3494 RepID=A0AA87ZVE1_FICCA|nr:hypothetical protein TIFTF001_010402 [Ficus carica]
MLRRRCHGLEQRRKAWNPVPALLFVLHGRTRRGSATFIDGSVAARLFGGRKPLSASVSAIKTMAAEEEEMWRRRRVMMRRNIENIVV